MKHNIFGTTSKQTKCFNDYLIPQVSELGDKTFFIAAILAMRNNKLTVFLAAISALAVMTVLSALLGFVVTTFIPREYTYYTCTAIMFLFGETLIGFYIVKLYRVSQKMV